MIYTNLIVTLEIWSTIIFERLTLLVIMMSAKLIIIEKLVFQILNTYPFTSTIGSTLLFLCIRCIKAVTNNK
jgi:hypothetical protein